MNKKKNEQKHAMMRFSERGHIHFSKRTNELFCLLIRTKKAIFLKKQSNRVTHWKIPHEGKYFECVYDKDRKQIVTVLSVEEIVQVPEKRIKRSPRKLFSDMASAGKK